MADNEVDLACAPVAISEEKWDTHDLTDELLTFLREAGTPEELRFRDARLLFEFREILRTVPPDTLSEEQRFFVKQTMTIMREHLTKLRAQAEWAVAMLAREGIRFDRDNNRFERLEGFGRMRRHRFADDVIEAYHRIDAQGNTRAARVRISEALRNSYPDELLSPRAYFPIWQCIEEHLARGI
ncbi:MAG TPA: hypothetical protein VEK15_02880 [Vicinamibacteria bacterium]|nr:hypothetical protein [Vicinamibacteria bacterium]